MKKLIFSAAIAASLMSCGSGENNAKQEQTAEPTKECNLIYAPQSVTMEWTAFKTSEKIGVPGSFHEIKLLNTKEGKTVQEVFAEAIVELRLPSVFSNNDIRDPKIREFFFGNIENERAKGQVIEIIPMDEKSGKMIIKLGFNGLMENIEAKYFVNKGTMSVNFDLDINKFKGEKALGALNEECDDLHKGADGKSILWPDVNIVISAQTKEDCK